MKYLLRFQPILEIYFLKHHLAIYMHSGALMELVREVGSLVFLLPKMDINREVFHTSLSIKP